MLIILHEMFVHLFHYLFQILYFAFLWFDAVLLFFLQPKNSLKRFVLMLQINTWISRSGFIPLLRHLARRHAKQRRRVFNVIWQLLSRRQPSVVYIETRKNVKLYLEYVFMSTRKNFLLTGSFNALRRKKSLQLSHATTSKWRPRAGEPQITQINGFFLFPSWFVDCLSTRDWKHKRRFFSHIQRQRFDVTDRSHSSILFSSSDSKIMVSNDDGILFFRTCSTIFSSLVVIIIRRWLEFVAEAIIDKIFLKEI